MMLGTEMFRHFLRSFEVRRALDTNRKCTGLLATSDAVVRLVEMLDGDGGNETRIEASGEENSEWYIRHQPLDYSVNYRLLEFAEAEASRWHEARICDPPRTVHLGGKGG